MHGAELALERTAFCKQWTTCVRNTSEPQLVSRHGLQSTKDTDCRVQRTCFGECSATRITGKSCCAYEVPRLPTLPVENYEDKEVAGRKTTVTTIKKEMLAMIARKSVVIIRTVLTKLLQSHLTASTEPRTRHLKRKYLIRPALTRRPHRSVDCLEAYLPTYHGHFFFLLHGDTI